MEHSIMSAGIDTAKDKLDLAIHGQQEVLTTPNAKAGFEALARRLAAHGVTRVGIEATGGYERAVTRYLQQAGFTVLVLQPLQVRAFARMRLQRAKNDKIDARLIAACTQALDPAHKLAAEPRFDALQDHLTVIEQMEEDRARLLTRLEHVREARLRRMYQAEIRRFEKRIADELKRLRAEVRAHADLAARVQLVCSIPCVALRTALTIVIRLPELGRISREEVAALGGVAPFVHQSGKYQGQTHIGGGRARLRRGIYMAAFAGATQWNPPLMALYERLRAKGKCHKAAVVACMRKLLIFANTVVARGTNWQDRATPA